MSKDDEYDYLFKGSNPPALALHGGFSFSTASLLLLTFFPPEWRAPRNSVLLGLNRGVVCW